jgi:3-hydroxyisobutyrate dehydrogenase
MGLPICANLVSAGYEVHASDRRAELAAAARGCGAHWHGSAREVTCRADVLITILPGAREIRELMIGAGEMLGALSEGATWIDMTTTSPAIGREICARASERGIGVLDAPVGGDPVRAEQHTLALYVGGDGALLRRHRSLLETIADPQQICHVGGSGAGYITKLLVNLLWFGQALATAEALLVAQRSGIDLEVLRRALAASAAASEFIRRDVDVVLDGGYLESFGLERCCEELDAVAALADELQLDLEVARLVARTYGRALERFGPRDGELLGVALLEQEANTTLRRRH